MNTEKRIELKPCHLVVSDMGFKLVDTCSMLLDEICHYLVEVKGIPVNDIHINYTPQKSIQQVCARNKPVYEIKINFDMDEGKVHIDGTILEENFNAICN